MRVSGSASLVSVVVGVEGEHGDDILLGLDMLILYWWRLQSCHQDYVSKSFGLKPTLLRMHRP